MSPHHSNHKMKLAQVQWACRRGMLELDVLLGPFCEQHYLSLSPEDQAIFIGLLYEPDPDLFAWLLNREPPPIEYANIIQLIQKHAKTRI